MAQSSDPPASLRRSLEGYDVVRGTDRSCPGCGLEYERGSRLVAVVSQDAAGEWSEPDVVCSDCGARTLPPDARRTSDRTLLIAVDVVATPQALVLDGDSIAILDRSPAADTSPAGGGGS